MVSAALQRPREALILAHTGVAKSFAVSFSRKHNLPTEDMCQEAMVALVLAADTYDPARGAAFSTHAVWVIRTALNRAARREQCHSHPFTLTVLKTDSDGRQRGVYARLAVVALDEIAAGDDQARVVSIATPHPDPEEAVTRAELLAAARLALKSAATRRRGMMAQAMALNRAAGSPQTPSQLARRYGAPAASGRRLDSEILALARAMM